MYSTLHQHAVHLLNEAQLAPREPKLAFLTQLQDLVCRQAPALLGEFLQNILEFQIDRVADVRKFVVQFIEQICATDLSVLLEVLRALLPLADDESPVVIKRVIVAFTNIYPMVLNFIISRIPPTERDKQIWKTNVAIRDAILRKLSSENDGVRSHVLKFLEALIVIHTPSPPDSANNSVSIDSVPNWHPILDRASLEREGRSQLHMFLGTLSYSGSSSSNLMAVVNATPALIKSRPYLTNQVVDKLIHLHDQPPITMTKLQEASLNHTLKLQLLNILRMPAAEAYQQPIVSKLVEMGAQSQISSALKEAEKRKSMPPEEEPRKRFAPSDGSGPLAKRPFVPASIPEKPLPEVGRLQVPLVAQLVIESMHRLPPRIPDAFLNGWLPPAFRHLAPPPPPATKGSSGSSLLSHPPGDLSAKILEGLPATGDELMMDLDVKDIAPQPLIPPSKPKEFVLSAPDLSSEQCQQASLTTLQRLLGSYKQFGHRMRALWTSVVIRLVTSQIKSDDEEYERLSRKYRDMFVDFLEEDFRNRISIGISWLQYERLSNVKREVDGREEEQMSQRYEACFETLLRVAWKCLEPRDRTFVRLFTDSPLLTPKALEYVRRICEQEERLNVGLSTLRELINSKPLHRDECVAMLLEFSCNPDKTLRTAAVLVAKLWSPPSLELEKDDVPPSDALSAVGARVESHAVHQLQKLTEPLPEESVPQYLELLLSLCPRKPILLTHLNDVYAKCSPTVQKSIRTQIAPLVKIIGMKSATLLNIIETYPDGSETLVLRILFVLTEKARPSPELVSVCQTVYESRGQDGRFIIPVLSTLSKKDILKYLPHLVNLPPTAVREVIARLVDSSKYPSPMLPSEVLVALHNVDPSKEEGLTLKKVIQAMQFCFSYKSIFKQEVMAAVLQQLVDHTPIPVLFMRTVIQSVTEFPNLTGFIRGILQRLITKKVWTNKMLWEGYVKCCLIMLPHSKQVLLQLPRAQLLDALRKCPELVPAVKDRLASKGIAAADLAANKPLPPAAAAAAASVDTRDSESEAEVVVVPEPEPEPETTGSNDPSNADNQPEDEPEAQPLPADDVMLTDS